MGFKACSGSCDRYHLLLVWILVIEGIRAQTFNECELPVGNSCTDLTPLSTRAEGLGVFYESPCNGVGCGFFRPECRLCWIHPNATDGLDRPQCPECVADRLRGLDRTVVSCDLPHKQSCTSLTPKSTQEEGLGVYYESPCTGVGCGFLGPECRLCWIHPNATGRLDRPPCPKCVADRLRELDSQPTPCQLPIGNPCTRKMPPSKEWKGFGLYYENPCRGIGCQKSGRHCRLCSYHSNPKDRKRYPTCPPCVAAMLDKP